MYLLYVCIVVQTIEPLNLTAPTPTPTYITNTTTLQVQKKSSSIQKNEINSQKCRHRYLPKYRELIQDRDKHCIVEHRIRCLYEERLETIVGHVSKYCRDRDLVNHVQETMAYLEHDLDNMPKVPVPEGLQTKL